MPAADQILYSPDAMRTQSQALMTLAEDLDGEAARMNEIINGLEGNWDGQEYDTFLGEYDEFKLYQQKFSDAVRTFGDYVKQTADSAEEIDQQRAGVAQSIVE